MRTPPDLLNHMMLPGNRPRTYDQFRPQEKGAPPTPPPTPPLCTDGQPQTSKSVARQRRGPLPPLEGSSRWVWNKGKAALRSSVHFDGGGCGWGGGGGACVGQLVLHRFCGSDSEPSGGTRGVLHCACMPRFARLGR